MRGSRRSFLTLLGGVAGSFSLGAIAPSSLFAQEGIEKIDNFSRPDGHSLGNAWEGLNPGYWKIENKKLRRQLKTIGERARKTGFPFHYETHKKGKMETHYDPSLPLGILYAREWFFGDGYEIEMDVRVKNLTPETIPEGDDKNWKMYNPDWGAIGICFGAKTQFESFYPSTNASLMLILKESGEFGFMRHTNDAFEKIGKIGRLRRPLRKNDKLNFRLQISPRANNQARIVGTLNHNRETPIRIVYNSEDRKKEAIGYSGIAARGLLDIEIDDIHTNISPRRKLNAPLNECHVCYALGDSLREENGEYKVRFVSLFRNNGRRAFIRVSEEENPKGGWKRVPVAGKASIINNDFRRNSAIIDVKLPANPAEKTLYYTIWKDGQNVTADPRPGTESVGMGTGLVGDIPSNGQYVGRLPKLTAPYRICGLSCHAVHTARHSDLPQSGIKDRKENIPLPFFVHDQPCYGAFEYLEDYEFQIMLWDDDVFYMELLLYPPSTDDAYRLVNHTLGGPTTRWQMMRHWNVLNPGDHDFGMDDIKGPEQILLRNKNKLGQDIEYLQRNFQIVFHVMMGEENPTKTDNPKRWRKWKMPNHDFSLMILDSRLWRNSQDTDIWQNHGWAGIKNLYSRHDPTRSLLGEEQFSWLQNQLATDSSPLICLTGLNSMHSIFSNRDGEFKERDRVVADFASWVSAGVDRVLHLMSGRKGVVSVGGDVHVGSIIKNEDLNLYECCFGPIGRWGGRRPKPGFGRKMEDYEGRKITCHAFYQQEYNDPDLRPLRGPSYWNFLEMVFNPLENGGEVDLAIRNIVDKPAIEPRGGGWVKRARANEMGREISARLPKIKTLANADILFLRPDSSPITGTRSNDKGLITLKGLIDIAPNTTILMLARAEGKTESKLIRTTSP